MRQKPNDYPVTMTVNGQPRTLEVPPHHTLLKVLQRQLDLTGSKECCAEGECGACTVLVDGRAVNACLLLAVEADGCEVVTIEGLASGGRLDAVQEAFLETGAIQCGYCMPGMILSAKYLLSQHPHPSPEQVKEGLAGNLCRCGGYSRIELAVMSAAEKLAEEI
jgi:carbon-monoxide dehydrogenase small subunit